jgi:hypothetical protein
LILFYFCPIAYGRRLNQNKKLITYLFYKKLIFITFLFHFPNCPLAPGALGRGAPEFGEMHKFTLFIGKSLCNLPIKKS